MSALRIGIVAAMGALAVSGIAQTPMLSPQALSRAQVQIDELQALKRSWTPIERKIDSNLLYTLVSWQGRPITRTVSRLETGIQVNTLGRVTVDLDANVTPLLLSQLQGFGATILSYYPQYDAVRAEIPLFSLKAIAGLGSVYRVRQQEVALANEGNLDSEGNAAQRVTATRNKYGLNGTGVKVGVLSDSVGGLATSQASGDLPSVQVLDAGTSGSEGTAMLEIVHDLAPGSPLAFATGFGGQAGFATNIQALANAGCKVIVDDITYLGEPAFQDGIIAQAADNVTSQGAFFFTSAGNENRLSANNAGVWEGNYLNSGNNNLHKFPGNTTQNQVTVAGTGLAYLQWSDPWGASGNDYDLYVVNASGTVVGSSSNIQDGNDLPLENTTASVGNFLMIQKFSGQDRFVRVQVFRGTLAKRTKGQTYGHHTATFAIDVAAVDARNRTTAFTTANEVETFSSDGPRKMFYTANGTAITPGNVLATGGATRKKPDISAADGVVTTVAGFNPFYGTSAAAPHAAAIAALMLQHKSNHTFDTMLSNFSATSLDIMTAGWDVDSGHGILMADAAVEKQLKDSYTTFTVAPGSIALGATTTGTIKLSLPAPPSGLKFNITSQNNSLVSVPATVTVPSGSKQATFTINGVGATTGTNITVGVLGKSKQVSVVVTAAEPDIDRVTVSPAKPFGGNTATGRVYLTGPAPLKMTITLTSNKTGVATVPATVDIPKNATSVSFPITTKAVANETVVKITAKRTGIASAFVNMTVMTPKLSSVSFSPSTVAGGSNSTGTVTINVPAPAGGLVVTLVSAVPSRVSVPATITIPKGATSKTFTATTTPGTSRSVKVTASRTGSTNASGSLTLN